jgi:hypothetical protein
LSQRENPTRWCAKEGRDILHARPPRERFPSPRADRAITIASSSRVKKKRRSSKLATAKLFISRQKERALKSSINDDDDFLWVLSTSLKIRSKKRIEKPINE